MATLEVLFYGTLSSSPIELFPLLFPFIFFSPWSNHCVSASYTLYVHNCPLHAPWSHNVLHCYMVSPEQIACMVCSSCVRPVSADRCSHGGCEGCCLCVIRGQRSHRQ